MSLPYSSARSSFTRPTQYGPSDHTKYTKIRTDPNWGAGGTGREAGRQAAARERQEEEEALWRSDHDISPGVVPVPEENGAEAEGYYYEQAQALAEELKASDEGATNATTASFKLRVFTGCLDAGFWTYCSAQYSHKWYHKKYATPRERGLSTAGRVVAGTTGAIVAVAGGGAAAGCIVAAGATVVDDQFELMPLEVHCILGGGSAMLAGAYVMYEAIFGG